MCLTKLHLYILSLCNHENFPCTLLFRENIGGCNGPNSKIAVSQEIGSPKKMKANRKYFKEQKAMEKSKYTQFIYYVCHRTWM